MNDNREIEQPGDDASESAAVPDPPVAHASETEGETPSSSSDEELAGQTGQNVSTPTGAGPATTDPTAATASAGESETGRGESDASDDSDESDESDETGAARSDDSNEADEKPADASAPDPEAADESVEEESDPGEIEGLFLSPDDSDAEELEFDEAPAEAETMAATAPSAAPAEPDPELLMRIEGLETERDDLKNRMLRTAADLDNFRKRTAREKEELRKYGIDRVVLELLPVLDNLERALEHADKAAEDNSAASIIDGVRMVQKQFVGALGKHGVAGFESKGEMFDPQRHEAIQQVETAEHPTGTVLEEYQKGYFLHERLIRPALVVVSKQLEPAEEADVAEEADLAEEVEAGEEADTAEEAETPETDVPEAEEADDADDESADPEPEAEDAASSSDVANAADQKAGEPDAPDGAPSDEPEEERASDEDDDDQPDVRDEPAVD